MESSHILSQVFYRVLLQGHRNTGQLKKSFTDCIKDSLKYCGISAKKLEACAEDEAKWRSTTHAACTAFENNRRKQISSARERRKASAASASPTAFFKCPFCPRACPSGIHLVSHTRAHPQLTDMVSQPMIWTCM